MATKKNKTQQSESKLRPPDNLPPRPGPRVVEESYNIFKDFKWIRETRKKLYPKTSDVKE